MNVHILQHVSFEGIGTIAQWLEEQGAKVSYTRFFESPALPQMENLDLIIVMGGPMSVHDEETLTWLRPEKQFICSAIKSGCSVIGICLGAQLIANSLGACVYRNFAKEIGWFPIEGTQNAADTFRFPQKCTVFHWHGETFDLPSGAIRLAKSTVCENQAFQIGRNVIGLQFHLEMTESDMHAIVDNCSDELIPGPFIQTKDEIQEVKSTVYAEVNRLMHEVLSYVTGNDSPK